MVKTTPQDAWNTLRKFWIDIGFVLAVEQPTLGIMETDWAENRAGMPSDFLREHDRQGRRRLLQHATSATSSARASKQGTEPGTVDIYISHRGAEQVPTTLIDNRSPAAFVWAVMPPDPGLEAEMLGRRDGALRHARAGRRGGGAGRDQPRPGPSARAWRRRPSGAYQLVVDDGFDRAWRRVGLALDRVGFTVVDRDRSKGTYFVRYADPETDGAKKDKGFLDKLQFWKTDAEKVEQYRITVARGQTRAAS